MNYKPMCLASVPGKLAEVIIEERVTQCTLDEHDMIGANQNGFYEGKSCFSHIADIKIVN